MYRNQMTNDQIPMTNDPWRNQMTNDQMPMTNDPWPHWSLELGHWEFSRVASRLPTRLISRGYGASDSP